MIQLSGQDEIPQVQAAQVAQEMESEAVFVLDVREDDEWQAGHISGATHMPLGMLNLAALPSNRPIVAVCRSGGRSNKAAEVIAEHGLDVANLDGGMRSWDAAGLPHIDVHGNPGQII